MLQIRMSAVPQTIPRVIDGTLAEMANFPTAKIPVGNFFFAKDDGPDGSLYFLSITGSVRSWKKIGGSSAGWPKYVVSKGDPLAPYTTIQSAIDAAVGAGHDPTNPAVVLVHPGIYTENITASLGVDLVSFDNELGRNTTIKGTITIPPYPGADTAYITIAGFCFDTNGPANFLSFNNTAGNRPAIVILSNCNLAAGWKNTRVASLNAEAQIIMLINGCEFQVEMADIGMAQPFAFVSLDSIINVRDSNIACLGSGVPFAHAFAMGGSGTGPGSVLLLQDTRIIGSAWLTEFSVALGKSVQWTQSSEGYCIVTNNNANTHEFQELDFTCDNTCIHIESGVPGFSFNNMTCSGGARLADDVFTSFSPNREMTARETQPISVFPTTLTRIIDLVVVDTSSTPGGPVALPILEECQYGDRVTVSHVAGTTPLVVQGNGYLIDGIATYEIDPGRQATFQIDRASGQWRVVASGLNSPRTARFIVGNALMGDTLDSCDFLDPGDGSRITIALAAASAVSTGDVFVRSGIYTLTGGRQFVVPPNVTLRGAGVETRIVGDVSQRNVFQLQQSSGLKNMTLQLPAAIPGATGVIAVQATGDNVTIQDVTVLTTASANESLQGVIGGQGISNLSVLDCSVLGGTVKPAGIFTDILAAFFLDGLNGGVIRGVGQADYVLGLGPNLNSNLFVRLLGTGYKAASIVNTGTSDIEITADTTWDGGDADIASLLIADSIRSRIKAILTNSVEVPGKSAVFLNSNCSDNSLQLDVRLIETSVTIEGNGNTISSSVFRPDPTAAASGVVILPNAAENVVADCIFDAFLGIAVNGLGTKISGSRIEYSVGGASNAIVITSSAERTSVTGCDVRSDSGITVDGLQTNIATTSIVVDTVGISVTGNANRTSIGSNYIEGGLFGISITGGDRTMITGNNISSPASTGIQVVGIGSLYNTILGNSITAITPIADTGTGTINVSNQVL